MNIAEKTEAILFIRPNAEFVLRGDSLEWLDKEQPEPTEDEIDAALKAYAKNKKEELKEKAAKRAALLEKLGISEDEAKILLG